ncbi:hypothetical protein Sru01_23090 [Sphaerisporangium rufum]|uniref:Uncharacterized protein n=1 Tax=Sphaerisporangium rufum TaxID=1381558 RepID=A0A919R0C9_9ACTN|nr:hypothetical protein [Sphaerisporangium rufum]GII77327.1 hypothetical protein Sru01_23090 [Sphaerisporangium rufum]
MSGDPALFEAVAAAGSGPGAGGRPLLYSRVMSLCRLVGEERFFRAAFSRVRAPAGPEAGPCSGAAGDTWVLELDVEEVLRDAFGATSPAPAPRAAGAVPRADA